MKSEIGTDGKAIVSLDRDDIFNICKAGQGAACCRYILVDGNGFTCAKNTLFQYMIDKRVEEGLFVAVSAGGIANGHKDCFWSKDENS